MKVNLRAVPTEALEREFRARQGCADCRTQYSSGWYAVEDYRQICFRCKALRRLKAWKKRRPVAPVVTEATL